MFGAGTPRVRVACAAALIAAALSGCGPTPTATTSVSGSTLTVYVSAPPAATADDRAQDVLAAEQLAFARAGGRAGKYRLQLRILRDAKISDAARTAIQDASAIAYLGEIVPGTSADSIGIVGAQQILQVSPTDNAVELTQASPAVPAFPGDLYENLKASGRTFARVVPTDALEARVLVAEAVRQHARRLFVAREGGHYGPALAAAVERAARAAGVTVTVGEPGAAAASGSDAVLYAGASPQGARTTFDAVAASRPATKLLAPSALADTTFAAGLATAAQSALEVSSPGVMPSALDPNFAQAFRSATGHTPSSEAVFGYEAMDAVVSVLQHAGAGAANRTTVLKDFFALHNRSSLIGTYSIDANGDTSLQGFVISRLRGGRLTAVRPGRLSG